MLLFVAFRFHRFEVTDIVDELADDLYMLRRTGSLPLMMQVVAVTIFISVYRVGQNKPHTTLVRIFAVHIFAKY